MPQLSLKPATSGARFAPSTTRGLRSAAARPQTYDPATRTFEFVLASEKPCRTWRWGKGWDFVEIDEVLPMSGLEELASLRGAPILNSHSSWRLNDVIGVIEKAWIERDKLVCKGRLSGREGVDDIAGDIESGVLTSFSVGFQILEDGVAKDRKGDVPLLTVKRWKALEASVVAIPADDTAKIRSASGAKPTLRNATRSAPVDAETFRTRMAELFAGVTDQMIELITEGDDDQTETETKPGKTERSAETPPAPSAAAQAAQIRSLREACKRNGREAEFKALADSGADIAELRSLLVASIRTSAEEIDTTQKPASGKRGGGLVAFSETARGGKAAK